MSFPTLRTICAVSVFFGAALTLFPEGKEKRIASLCATAALVLLFCSLVRGLDWETYSLSLAKSREAAAAISGDAEEACRRLNRLVIERECEEYIMDKAADLGCPLREVKVSLRWSREGLWVPDSAVIRSRESTGAQQRLRSYIEAQLGIRADRQEWIIEESSD